MLVCVDTPPLLATVLELHYVVSEVSSAAQGTFPSAPGTTAGATVILMEGDDYIGHCVNVAARLCDSAQAGQALADPSVVDHLPRWGVVLERTEVPLRGVEKPVPSSSIGMATAGDGLRRDPICGLPLSEDTAEEAAEDSRGGLMVFCSDGCLDTWRRRPRGVSRYTR